MKNIFILLIGILIISCNQTKEKITNNAPSKTIKKTANFDWLLGKWERLDEEKGKRTFENWEKISVTEYSGIGFTIQSGDTIQQEKIRLIKTIDNWSLTVKVSEEAETVSFKMITHSGNEFTCENKEHDFPNKIRYWKNGNKINASVSNAEMEILFEFDKINK